MAVITFPKALTDRISDEGARALADILNTVENSAQKATLEIAEERFEKRVAQVEARLDAKIDTVAAGLKVEIADVKAELKTEIAHSEARLETKIAQVKVEISESKAEVIKWMFIFWAGQIGAMIAILFVFLKK